MKEYKRDYPLFSLCGLNCGLCPRYHTEGKSRCPGCGGPDFHLRHPSCAVINCNLKKDLVEYCYQCSHYPCAKYAAPSATDSFISYRNVIRDLEKARDKGLDVYKQEMEEKIQILETLIRDWNDGRQKGFYCLAVNLLEVGDLRDIMDLIRGRIHTQDLDRPSKINLIAKLIHEIAEEKNIDLKLRKH